MSVFLGATNKSKISEKEIKRVAYIAGEDFWSSVASLLPEIQTGDFPPDELYALNKAMEKAIRKWIQFNS